jgi:hypothetical protein
MVRGYEANDYICFMVSRYIHDDKQGAERGVQRIYYIELMVSISFTWRILGHVLSQETLEEDH